MAGLLGAVVYLHETGGLSPGPLSAAGPGEVEHGGFDSHASFEQECTHCHVPIHCISDSRCQDCHMEVARQRQTATGLHGKLPGTSRCQTCHKEHQGREARITEFAFVNVDHEKLAGFSLVLHQTDYEGNPMTCESCHSHEGFARESLDCLTCHIKADHDGTVERMERYGTECLDCHDGQDRMSDFDHNEWFLLEGGHQDVACETCHVDQVFAGTSSNCSDCHEEPEMHAAQFGVDCVRCHTPGAWAPAELKQHNFDLAHGGEGLLDCRDCHEQSYVLYTCDGCHYPDEMKLAHTEKETSGQDGCADCHVTGEEEYLVEEKVAHDAQ
jgi:hypothetical protein